MGLGTEPSHIKIKICRVPLWDDDASLKKCFPLFSNFEVKPLTAQLAIKFHQSNVSYTEHGYHNKVLHAPMKGTQHQSMQQKKGNTMYLRKPYEEASEINMTWYAYLYGHV